MVRIQDRLASAIDSFLCISHEPRDSANMQDFASNWESLFNETIGQSASLLEDDLSYDIADAMGVLCESLIELSVIEDDVNERVVKEHHTVKARHLSKHAASSAATAQTPTSLPSPPSSRESSPIVSSRRSQSTRRRSLSPHVICTGGSQPTSPTEQAAHDHAAMHPTSGTTPPEALITPSRVSPSPLTDTLEGSSWLQSPTLTENSSSLTNIDNEETTTAGASGANASMEIKDTPTVAEVKETESSPITPPATPSRSPSPSVESDSSSESSSSAAKEPKQLPTPSHIRPLLTHLVAQPYNLYPSKTLISEIALSTASSEKDINAYLSQLRSKLGWNGIRKTYFPPTQWSTNEMVAWLDGYWRYTHSELPSLKDYDIYMGANGISGTMRGLDVQLAILHDDLKGMYERMTGREGEGSDIGKAIKEGVKWSGKEEWERKRKELEKQAEALRKAQREEEKGLKRKFVEDEDYDGEEEARRIPRPRAVSAPQPQSKKRSRSESPESEDDGDSTPPPPAKRHCSLPTMSLSTPPDLENWFKTETPTWTLDAPVTLKAFSYDAIPMPSLVEDDSDSERGSSVGPSTPDSAEHVDLPSFDFSNLMQPTEYGGVPKPSELYVPTLPDAAFPELLNAQNLNIDLFAGLSAAPPVASTVKDLPSLSSSDQFISIPTSDEAPFDFGDPQSWSFNYEDLDLGSLGFDLNFGVDGV